MPAYDSQQIQMAGMEERERLDKLGLPAAEDGQEL